MPGSEAGKSPTANRNVLVTGATGFIGINVIRRLLREGYNIYAIVREPNKLTQLLGSEYHDQVAILQGDLLKDSDLEKLKCELPGRADHLDVVIHMIGGGPLTSNDRFSQAIQDLNYKSTYNLIGILSDTDKLSSLSLLLYFSSLAAMGIPDSEGNEIVYSEESLCNPVLPYEKAKLRTENFLKEITSKNNFKTVILRFPQVYGGNRDSFMQMVQLIRNGVFPVVRDRVGTLPLLHVSDAAKATFVVIRDVDQVKDNYDINLVCEGSYSYLRLSELVKRKYGKGGILKVPYQFFYLVTLAVENVFKILNKPEPLNRRRLMSLTKDRAIDCRKFHQTFNCKFDENVEAFIADRLT